MAGLDEIELMLEIAGLARGHLDRLAMIIRAGSEVAASEGFVRTPFRATYHVIMEATGDVYVTDDEPLYR